EVSLKLAGGRVIHLKASGKQVCVEGTNFRALSDCLLASAQTGQITLEGHARLEYRRDNAAHTHVTGDHVLINLPSLEARRGAGTSLIAPAPYPIPPRPPTRGRPRGGGPGFFSRPRLAPGRYNRGRPVESPRAAARGLGESTTASAQGAPDGRQAQGLRHP